MKKPLSFVTMTLIFLLMVLPGPGAGKVRASEANPALAYDQRVLDSGLRTAARRNDIEAMRGALARGAHVNSTSRDGLTALMYASRGCYPGLAHFLLKTGANPDQRDKSGRSALVFAIRSQCLPAVRMLLRTGTASLLFRDARGKTPEDYALSATELEVDGLPFRILHLVRSATAKARLSAHRMVQDPED